MRYLLVHRGVPALILVFAFNGCTVFESGVENKAEFTPALNQKVGVSCVDDSWCRKGLSCKKEKCQPCGCLKKESACTMTAECGSGLYCGSLRKCVSVGDGEEGHACENTAECKKGLICALEDLTFRCAKAGKVLDGEACSGTLDCAAGLMCVLKASAADEEGDAASKEASSAVCQSPNPNTKERRAVPLWEGVECEHNPTTNAAYFEIPRADKPAKDFYRLPFPNDIRRTSTGLDLSGHPQPPSTIVGRYWQAAEEDLTGFATNPVVVFRFSHDVAADTLNGENVHFKDITPGSPTFNLERNRRWQLNPNQTKYACANSLSVAANSPLRPNTTYAVYMTRSVIPNAGGQFTRSADLDAMLAASAPADPKLAAAYKAYEPLRTWFAETNTSPDTILNVAVFTTQDPEAMLPKLRAAVQNAAMPTVSDLMKCGSGAADPCADGSEERRCGPASANFVELHGRLALPIFQRGTAPYETPDQGGGIGVDADGKVSVARTANVCFTLTVPTQAPPESGYRLVIYGHGTGGGFTSAVREGLAEEFAVGAVEGADTATVPAATLTIDLPQHGDRRGNSSRPPEALFFNYVNPRAARDNVLQGAADLMALVRWAKSYNLAANISPSSNAIAFNPGRIALFGHSQGATHASLMLAYEPDVIAAMLSGQGGYLTQSLLNKTKPIDFATILPYALADADAAGALPGGAYHPMLAVFQMYLERSDPLNYAHRVWREPTQDVPAGHHLFMSYGMEDSYVPEQTQKAYAVNAEFTVVQPEISAIVPNSKGEETLKNVEPPLKGNILIGEVNRTVGLRQYSPKPGEDGHFVAIAKGSDGRADAVRFLLQALAGLSPQIGK